MTEILCTNHVVCARNIKTLFLNQNSWQHKTSEGETNIRKDELFIFVRKYSLRTSNNSHRFEQHFVEQTRRFKLFILPSSSPVILDTLLWLILRFRKSGMFSINSGTSISPLKDKSKEESLGTTIPRSWKIRKHEEFGKIDEGGRGHLINKI